MPGAQKYSPHPSPSGGFKDRVFMFVIFAVIHLIGEQHVMS